MKKLWKFFNPNFDKWIKGKTWLGVFWGFVWRWFVLYIAFVVFVGFIYGFINGLLGK